MEKWRADLYSDVLYHYGIKGQRWGTRRFQNKDGSLKPNAIHRYYQPNKEVSDTGTGGGGGSSSGEKKKPASYYGSVHEEIDKKHAEASVRRKANVEALKNAGDSEEAASKGSGGKKGSGGSKGSKGSKGSGSSSKASAKTSASNERINKLLEESMKLNLERLRNEVDYSGRIHNQIAAGKQSVAELLKTGGKSLSSLMNTYDRYREQYIKKSK